MLVVAPWNYPYLCSVNAVVPALMAGDRWSSRCPRRPPWWRTAGGEAWRPRGCPRRVPAGGCDHDAVGRSRPIPGSGSWPSPVRWQVAMPCSGRRQSVLSAPVWSWAERTPPTYGPTPPLEAPWPKAGRWRVFQRRVSPAARSSACTCPRRFGGWWRLSCFDSRLRLGHPLDPDTTLGPLVRRARRRSSAARSPTRWPRRPGTDGSGVVPGRRPGTAYLAPQVLINVDHGMRVMKEESFGPVVGIMPVDATTTPSRS